MGFVEYLRVRNAFRVFAIVLTLIVILSTVSLAVAFYNGTHDTGSSSHMVTISGGPDGTTSHVPARLVSLSSLPFTIPIAFVFAFASFCAIGMGTILGASLNKENNRGGFAFTKPVSRERLALTYFAIDFAGIAAIFVYATVLVLAAFAALGIAGKVRFDSGAPAAGLVGLGAAAMWYGLLQAATALRSEGGGLTIGLSWALFTILAPLYAVTQLGPIFHGAIAALDFFNPLAYYSIRSVNEDVGVVSLFGFDPAVSGTIVWGIALVMCALATFEWRRVEL